MKQKIWWIPLALMPLAVLPVKFLETLGGWLRELSLSGAGGNAAAWAIVLALTALPALGLLWRGRSKWDWLLLAAAGEIFAGLFFLVNPTLLQAQVSSEAAGTMWGFAFSGSTAATLLAWGVLRGLEALAAASSLGPVLEHLLKGSAVLLGWLACWSEGADLLAQIRAAAAANTAPEVVMEPTYLTLCLLAAADLAPMLLGCGLLFWGGRLARALDADPFGAETVDLARTVSRRCRHTAAASVLLCAGGNLLQMLLFPALHTSRFSVSFPFVTVLLAACGSLLCRYLQRAKEVSDENETII